MLRLKIPITKNSQRVLLKTKEQSFSLDEKITIPYGTFSNILKSKDFSSLEPDIDENKY